MDWARIKKHQSLLGSPPDRGEFTIITAQKPQSDKSLLIYLGIKGKGE